MTPTLLLADDSVTIRRVIELTFANEDIRVVSTADGEAAVRHLLAEKPDIVLADVGMPKMDGYEVATRIKKTAAWKDIPVLLLTGAFEPIDEARARASGCDGILVKPFEPRHLVERVKELLAGTPSEALWPANLPTVDAPAASSPQPAQSVARQPAPDAEVPAQPPQPEAAMDPGPWPVALPEALAVPEPAPVLAKATAMPTEAPRPSSPEAEATFRQEFAQLDAALADLKPQTAAPRLDVGTASDFARDLDVFRSGEPGTATRPFGDWDLPKAPPKGDSVPPATPAGAAPSAQDRGTSDVAVSKAQPTGSRKVASPKKPAAPPAGAAKSKGSLASAFSSLLAAEQAHPPTPPAPTLSEADVLEVVRRVLARMSDETVQRILIETAERLIKDEVEKIKTTPT